MLKYPTPPLTFFLPGSQPASFYFQILVPVLNVVTIARTEPPTRAMPFHSHSTVLTIQSLAQSVTQNDGLCFPLFPKLPEEIRCMIWRCYLDTPRIIGITNAYYRRLTLRGNASPRRRPSYPMRTIAFGQFRSSLRQVNQEARREDNRFMQVYNPRILPFHADLERDVFWFEWFSVSCTPLLGATADLMPRGLDGRVLRLSRVALHWGWWFRDAEDDKMVSKMGDLTRAGITQLFLVVREKVISRNREILFYEPGGEFSDWFGEEGVLSVSDSQATTWKELGEETRQKVKDLQRSQAEKRAKLQNSMLFPKSHMSRQGNAKSTIAGVDLEALDETEPEDSNHHKEFFDASWWEIPVFRFVEIVQISSEDRDKVPLGDHSNDWKPHYGERVSI